ncbi:MAG: hypothetical protein IPJ40_20215 [Saprospirales bacterium]|nr:hypothetical protein [Saprospirales bacterium]
MAEKEPGLAQPDRKHGPCRCTVFFEVRVESIAGHNLFELEEEAHAMYRVRALLHAFKAQKLTGTMEYLVAHSMKKCSLPKPWKNAGIYWKT